MISTLVESAFETGCLSVASEGLIYQVLTHRAYGPTDLDALQRLQLAVQRGKIQREASRQFTLLSNLMVAA